MLRTGFVRWVSGTAAASLLALGMVAAQTGTAHADALGPASGASFTQMQAPFTEATYGVAPSFLGGVAFAPNGDVWADGCMYSGGSLYRFSAASTTTSRGSTLHNVTEVPSNAGCGLTNGPGDKLYSNTGLGVTTLDANTGAQLIVGGPAGNGLGIAYDPADGTVAYPDSACAFGTSCPIDSYNPATGSRRTLINLPASEVGWVDGVAFDPTGRYLLLSVRWPSYAVAVIDATAGTLVRLVPLDHEPDGISFHWIDPKFVVTSDTDGTMTRLDFPGGDLSAAPTTSLFASGGYRGDLSLVGSDGCAYITQDGTRYADGSTDYNDSIVQICPGFTPSTGVTSGPAAQVLFLHGVTESYRDNQLFPELLGALQKQYGADYVQDFEYFQDAGDQATAGGCDPTAHGQQPPPTPDPSVGMPYISSQNDVHCDSQGDIGQNAARLDSVISSLYTEHGNRPVILIGYSMGGETIRSFLSYSTHLQDGVATGMVDSVLLMHGVEQGSWIADAAPLGGIDFPFNGISAGDLLGLMGLPNANRAAVKEFAPASGYMQWVDQNSDSLPAIPMYNTWGNEEVHTRICAVFAWGCIDGPRQSLGDLVLMPGTDNPTETPISGGERFLPGGASATRYEWAETADFGWDPQTDPLAIGLGSALKSAPQMHVNLPAHQAELTISDCQTHQPINEVTELLRVINARMSGTTYDCKP